MRQQFLTKDSVQNEIQLYDLASLDWSKFTFKRGFIPHYLTQAEVDRAWTVSYAFFGTTEFEDFIWLVNNIVNPFELVPGQMLKIPDRLDIDDFVVESSQNRLNNK